MHTDGGYESVDSDLTAGGSRRRHPALMRFVGTSSASRVLLDDIENIATARCPVLIEGESGVGKELVARIVHEIHCGPKLPFEAVNCGAIPETLLESELFGFVSGAFTGAVRSHRGVFERARNGSVFLDEIAEMTPSAQVRLLRVLQEGTYTPVGGETVGRSHARVIAATNRDLRGEVRHGRFREDLYYRLNVFPIRIPALRSRRQDIMLLVEHFLDENAKSLGRPRPKVQAAAVRRLLVYSYPGNVRELQNIVDALLIEARGAPEITDRHVVAVFSRHRVDPSATPADEGQDHDEEAAGDAVGEAGAWVLDQLRRYHFNLSLAEKMLKARQREAADPRSVPVCSRSGLTYYLQGESLRALAAERWSLDAAAARLAGDPTLVPRVMPKLRRFLEGAIAALREGGRTPGRRFIALRKSLAKLPSVYQEDLLRFSREFEQGRWPA